MTPEKVLGWSVEGPGKRSHLIGTADVVVGTSSPATVTVSFSLCGTTGHGTEIQEVPSQVPCARCMGVAFRLARKDRLPDMEIHKALRAQRETR